MGWWGGGVGWWGGVERVRTISRTVAPKSRCTKVRSQWLKMAISHGGFVWDTSATRPVGTLGLGSATNRRCL
jgi:hypothetical protein